MALQLNTRNDFFRIKIEKFQFLFKKIAKNRKMLNGRASKRQVDLALSTRIPRAQDSY